MAIEFDCNQCGTRLRVPDGTSGKQAQCPKCDASVEIPAVSPVAPISPPEPEAANPYLSPSLTSFEAEPAEQTGEIRPTRIDLGDVVTRSWAIFTENLGFCIAVTLISFVIELGAGLAMGAVTGIAMAADQGLGEAMDSFTSIVQQVFSLWIGLGETIIFLKIATGRQAEISELFSGGPFLWRAIGASLLVCLMVLGIAAVLCGLPALVVGLALEDGEAAGIAALVGLAIALFPLTLVGLMFSQIQFLIVDRNSGVMESLRLSREITTGNKGSLFLLCLVTIGILLLGAILCLVGLVFAAPLVSVIWTVTYLVMTGQPTGSRQEIETA